MVREDRVTAEFEASRPRLHALAYRMLGSRAEAEDAYFVVEADDLDEAVEIAARVPAARHGGAVESAPWGPTGDETAGVRLNQASRPACLVYVARYG